MVKTKKKRTRIPCGSIPFHEGGPNVPLTQRTVVNLFPLEEGKDAPCILTTGSCTARYAKREAVAGMTIEHGVEIASAFDSVRSAALNTLNQKPTARVFIKRKDLVAALASVKPENGDFVALDFISLPDEVVEKLTVMHGKRYVTDLVVTAKNAAIRVAASLKPKAERVVLFGLPTLEKTAFKDEVKVAASNVMMKKRKQQLKDAVARAKALIKQGASNDGTKKKKAKKKTHR